jgi:chloramphenicol 3-O phosphotransferase
MTARVIVLIGTSSAGKSTLAQALQASLPEHFLLFALDDVFRMVSPRWGGGLGGPLSYDGFRYERNLETSTTTIRVGDVGRMIIDGMHHVVAAFASAGVNIIVDDMLLDEQVLRGWAHALAPYDTCLVKVYAPFATLDARELTRRNPAGLARGHAAINDIRAYDWTIDTSRTSAHAAAHELASWLQTNPKCGALRTYAV